jgi:transposase
MKRHEVTDEPWGFLEPLVRRPRAKTGRTPREVRTLLNGMMWILRTGAPWRDLPERFGPWQTVYNYFNRCRAEGLWDRILEALQIRLDSEGRIDGDLWCVDGSAVRPIRAAAGAYKKTAATRRNRRTSHGAASQRSVTAAAADSGASSTWSLTVKAFPCRSKSAPDKIMRRPGLGR